MWKKPINISRFGFLSRTLTLFSGVEEICRSWQWDTYEDRVAYPLTSHKGALCPPNFVSSLESLEPSVNTSFKDLEVPGLSGRLRGQSGSCTVRVAYNPNPQLVGTWSVELVSSSLWILCSCRHSRQNRVLELMLLTEKVRELVSNPPQITRWPPLWPLLTATLDCTERYSLLSPGANHGFAWASGWRPGHLCSGTSGFHIGSVYMRYRTCLPAASFIPS